MNTVLRANSFDSRPLEMRRLRRAAVLLAVLGIVSAVVRLPLMPWLEGTNFGHPARVPLLTAALRWKGVDLDSDFFLILPSIASPYQDVWSHWAPPEDFVAWRDLGVGQWLTNFADRTFTPRGTVVARNTYTTQPGDYDGDGHWEVLVRMDLPNMPRNALAWALVRMAETENELLWVGVALPNTNNFWKTPRVDLWPVWKHEPGEDVWRLDLVRISEYVTPGGQIACGSPQTVASFAWDRTGGVLRPRSPAEVSDIVIYTLDEPLPFSNLVRPEVPAATLTEQH